MDKGHGAFAGHEERSNGNVLLQLTSITTPNMNKDNNAIISAGKTGTSGEIDSGLEFLFEKRFLNLYLSNIIRNSFVSSIRNPPWWNRRTRLERYLCLISTVSLIACIILGISLVTLHNTGKFCVHIDVRMK